MSKRIYETFVPFVIYAVICIGFVYSLHTLVTGQLV